jgi:hypothetical protein
MEPETIEPTEQETTEPSEPGPEPEMEPVPLRFHQNEPAPAPQHRFNRCTNEGSAAHPGCAYLCRKEFVGVEEEYAERESDEGLAQQRQHNRRPVTMVRALNKSQRWASLNLNFMQIFPNSAKTIAGQS